MYGKCLTLFSANLKIYQKSATQQAEWNLPTPSHFRRVSNKMWNDKHNIAEACPTTQHVQKAQQFDLIEAVAVIEATAFSVISASRGSMRHRKHLCGVDVIYKIWKKYEQTRAELWILYVAPTHITGYHTSNAGNIGKKTAGGKFKGLKNAAWLNQHIIAAIAVSCQQYVGIKWHMIAAAIQGRKHRQLHQVGSCWWHAYILIYPDIDQPLEKK